MSEPMTREQAIQYWTEFRQEAIDMIANGEDKGDQLKEQIPMCDIVLSALIAQQEQEKCCIGCKHDGLYQDEIEYSFICPCTLCSRRNTDMYEPKEATNA